MLQDEVRYDDNVSIYVNNSDCGTKVGEFRLYSKLKRGDYTDEYTDNERSEWAMSQKGFMWPLVANVQEFNHPVDYFGEQYSCWTNDFTELTQNWNRSELGDLGIVAYSPSYQDETKTSLSGSISASAPKAVGVSVSVDSPKLKIQSEKIDKKLKSTYEYQNAVGGRLGAADEDVQLGTATAFDSLKPDSGDKIAPTYMYGQFNGYGFSCAWYDTCVVDNGHKTPGASTFNFFYEQNIDDLN